MRYNEVRKIIDGIVENEINHIQQYGEVEFVHEDIEQKELNKTTREIFEKLKDSLSEEQQELLFNLETAITTEWTNLCMFYFREGLRAGVCNLKFLSEIDKIGYIL